MSKPSGFTTITASNLMDPAGNKITGTLVVQPTDGNDRPITAAAGGQLLGKTPPIAVTEGALPANFWLPDTTLTYPRNISYRFSFYDTNGVPFGKPLVGVQFSGDTFNLDTYVPNVPTQAVISAGPQGPPGEVTNAALSDAINALAISLGGELSGTTYGTDNPGSNNTTPIGIFAGLNTPCTAAGPLSSVSVQAATSGGILTLYIYTLSSSGVTIVDKWTVTVPTTGIVTFNAGTDFAARNLEVGQYIGYFTASGAQLNFLDGGGGSFVFAQGSGFNPGNIGNTFTAQSFYQPGTLALSYEVLDPDSTPVISTVEETAASVLASKALTPWVGKKFGVFGDSISAQFANQWQNFVALHNGMTLAMQDARYARHLNEVFENYTLSGGTYTRHTSTTSPASNLVGVTTGNTLAQDLAGLDLIIIELLTNTPTNAFGSSTDASTVDSAVGNMKLAIEAIEAAKPANCIIAWLTPYQANPAASAMATQAQFVQLNTLIKQVMLLYGHVVIDAGGLCPINPQTWGSYLRDGVHPTDAAFTYPYGAVIANEIRKLAWPS